MEAEKEEEEGCECFCSCPVFDLVARAHTHLTILCRILMANVFNVQCFILIAIIIVCAVFFHGFSRNGKIGRRMLSLHEQMSIIIIKYSQVKYVCVCWVSFLFSIRSSPFCKCVCACGSKFNCGKVIAIIIWSVRCTTTNMVVFVFL